MKIKYHLDENVPNSIANGLKHRDIDVTTSNDAGLLGASDDEHIKWALENQRVIFTTDDDFLRLASGSVPHAGITYCHQRHRSIGEMIHGLVHLWRGKTAEEMVGQVHYI